MLKKTVFWRRFYQLIAIAFGSWLILDIVARLGVDIFWFQEVGYLQVFSLRLLTQGLLWAIGFGITAVYLFGNLVVAERLVRQSRVGSREQGKESRGAGETRNTGEFTKYQLPSTNYHHTYFSL